MGALKTLDTENGHCPGANEIYHLLILLFFQTCLNYFLLNTKDILKNVGN